MHGFMERNIGARLQSLCTLWPCLDACAERFDVIENFKKKLVLGLN